MFISSISILFYPITLEGRRDTTDEFATIPFHLDLFSAALVELAKSIPVHSLILSSHLFFCLPLFLFPFTVPCRIVFAKPEALETWPNHLSFRFLTRVRSSSYSSMAAWIISSISILFYPITLEGRRDTTDEFATIPFHLDLFSAALVELAKSIPVHSLILSSHLFFCLPLFLFPFTVPCRIVFAKPEALETWPNHLSFRFLTRVRSSSYSSMAAWIFLRTSSLVTWPLYEMFNSLR